MYSYDYNGLELREYLVLINYLIASLLMSSSRAPHQIGRPASHPSTTSATDDYAATVRKGTSVPRSEQIVSQSVSQSVMQERTLVVSWNTDQLAPWSMMMIWHESMQYERSELTQEHTTPIKQLLPIICLFVLYSSRLTLDPLYEDRNGMTDLIMWHQDDTRGHTLHNS